MSMCYVKLLIDKGNMRKSKNNHETLVRFEPFRLITYISVYIFLCVLIFYVVKSLKHVLDLSEATLIYMIA